MDAFEKEKTYTLPTYGKFPFALVKGEGNYVENDKGDRFLDLYGGHAVSQIGHSHPRWVRAITDQLSQLDFYSNVCYHPERAAAAELLVTHSYPSMSGVFFCNSGAEANETALKLARKVTGRPKVVAMNGGFHGRTTAALSVTASVNLRSMFKESLDQYTYFVDLGDLEAIHQLPSEELAAVIIEPIQSMRGIYHASAEYYQSLREYCSSKGIALIFDEVQTGTGRTGEWYAGHHWNVEPDIVSTAKGVGGGFPVGVVIANDHIASDVQIGDHGSTFGGGPLAAAAVAATYRVIIEENLVERVRVQGAKLQARLTEMVGHGVVREVRGLGYLLGIECEVPAGDVSKHFLENRILVGKSDQPNTLRLLPPLTVTDEEWERFLEVLAAFRVS